MRFGYTTIKVLSFLDGLLWDDVTAAYVRSLRPSSTRVTSGEIKSDAKLWRVTVLLGADGRVNEITQEVEVGLPVGVASGYCLANEIERRRSLLADGKTR